MHFSCSFRTLWILIGLSVGSVQAAAHSPFCSPAASDTLLQDSLHEVIVTAQRRETSLFDTPASLELLSSQSMRERQVRTVPEALMATTGVFNQSTSRSGSPFLRGLTGNQTLLLIDGIRLNNATFRYGPNQYLNTIDPFSVDRIEVLKGHGSVGYGSDALGGTVQIFSRTPRFAEDGSVWNGRLVTQLASQGMEQSGHGALSYSNQRVAVMGGATVRHFGDLVGGDTTGRQHPSGYDEQAFYATARFRLDKSHFITLSHQKLEQSNQPVYHKLALENFLINQFSIQDRNLSYLRWQHAPERGNSRFTATVSLQQTTEGRESQKNNNTTKTEEEDKVRTWGGSFLYEATPLSMLRLNTGAEVYSDLVHSTRRDINTQSGLASARRGLYPDASTHTSAALFTLATWSVQKWQVSGGLRYNYFHITVSDETLGKSVLTPSALVGSLSALYALSDYTNLYANVSSAFRAPNIDDLGTLGIVDFRYEIPTATLRPESSFNKELGFRHQTARFQADFALFHNRLTNLITRIRAGSDSIAGYPVYRKENVQEGYIWGLEGDFSLALNTYWAVQGALAWQYGQNVTRNEPQRRIPPLFGRMGLRYARRGLSGTAEVLFAGKQDRLAAGDISDNRIPAGGTPGWVVGNIYVSYTWGKVTLRTGAWNLLNADYRYHGSGVNSPGRHATLAVAWSF